MIQHTTVLALCLLLGVTFAGFVNAGIRGSWRAAFVWVNYLAASALYGVVLNSGLLPKLGQVGLELLFVVFSFATAGLVLCLSIAFSGLRESARGLGVCVIFAASTYYILSL
ncbi:MAG: hypothetical protein ACN6PB_14395 [Achromobacter kerstersii]|uniref:hypothetical protein n=1 Tax=Achromobacter kerstersii TaxID=1353890 RepID=UPI003CFF6167